MPKPSRPAPVSAAPKHSLGWLEILAMKHDYGVQVDPLAQPATIEAEVIRRLHDTWSNGATDRPWPLTQMFYALKAQYRHLTRAQRAEKLPAFVLAALNDPRGGIDVVPLRSQSKRAA